MNDPFERAVQREESERRGRRRRAVWRRFGIHLRIYVIVNLLLAAIWVVEAVVDGGHPLWFLQVAWGWGIGLLIHYVIVTQVTGTWWPRRQPGPENGASVSAGSHQQPNEGPSQS